MTGIWRQMKRIINFFVDEIQSRTFDPKRYWTLRGLSYMVEYPPDGERNETLFLDTLKMLSFNRLLDIGCGYGRYLKCIAQAFPDAELVGVDISPTQIENAREFLREYPQVRLEEVDGVHLPFADDYFDVSISYGCMIHVPPSELKQFFNEACRVTRSKGIYLESSLPYRRR